MTTRVITLRPWEVRALLVGATQVRRPIPLLLPGDRNYIHAASHEEWVERRSKQSPFGSPGTTLLCKEAYAIEQQVECNGPPYGDGRPVWRNDIGEWRQAHYRATDPTPALQCEHEDCQGDPCTHPWRPARTLPRDLIRLKPVVVSVRAERCSAITEADAASCGMYLLGREWVAPGVMMTCVDGAKAMDWPCHESARDAFKSRWDSDWDKKNLGWWHDPWQWVCEVKNA